MKFSRFLYFEVKVLEYEGAPSDVGDDEQVKAEVTDVSSFRSVLAALLSILRTKVATGRRSRV